MIEKKTKSDAEIERIAHILCGVKAACERCIFDDENCKEKNQARELYEQGLRFDRSWKAVDLELPKKSGKYIVGTKYGKVYVCQFTVQSNGQCYWGQGTGGKRIVFWMEMPSFPRSLCDFLKKGGEEDERGSYYRPDVKT